jgi:hypothetical protein
MAITRFDAPANWTEDLTTEPLRQKWSERMSKLISGPAGVGAAKRYLGDKPVQFYNELTQAKDEADRVELPIKWPGFPKQVERLHGENTAAAWKTAEDDTPTAIARQRYQDEYLEWHVTRDSVSEKIVRVEFTCEGPEYWDFLAEEASDVLLKNYQTNIDPKVKKSELFTGTAYNRLNKWNTGGGAMHLIHGANTLGAEVNIAAEATILRKDPTGQPIVEATPLIKCAGYGNQYRSSDPLIGFQVNALARKGYSITLKNPVGLYMDGLDAAGWKKPDGTKVGDYFKVVRGQKGMGLRAVYEVPAGEFSGGQPFVVGDITIGGEKIAFGGQIAKRITMKLVGVACEKGKIANPAFACGPPGPVIAGVLEEIPTRNR